jgi:hypothetical protein
VPKRKDIVEERLGDLGHALKDLWKALTKDPKREARKERVWRAFSGAAVGVATVAARRAAGKAWGVLTGERPPPQQKAP